MLSLIHISTPAIFARCSTPEEFIEIPIEELEELVHPCGFYKNKSKNIKLASQKILNDFNGKVPTTMEELITIPGVGRKSANVIMLEALDVYKRQGERQSAITLAEGKKEAAILEAEADREAKIRRAAGEADAIKKVAEAKAEEIQMVYDAIMKANPDDKLVQLKSLEALKEVANGNANKVFIPFEATNALSSLGAAAEMFKDEKKK